MAYTTNTPEQHYFVVRRNSTILSALAVTAGKARTGERVTKFKDKIKAGQDASSPYTLDSTKVVRRRDGESTVKWVNHFTPGVITTDKYSGHNVTSTLPVSHLPYSTTVVDAECLMKIIKKIRQESSQMNGQSFVGELREAIHGLRHPFESLRTLVYSHLTTLSKRKRDMMGYPPVKRKRAWRSAISDTWLETSFGLMPLVHDTKDIAESIARFVTQFPPRRSRITARVEALDRKVDYTAHDDTLYGGLWLNRSVTHETTRFCTYSVGLEAKSDVAPGSLDQLRRILGFTPENFVPALYEVMPWSWLIDYFSNVGDIILAGTTDTSGVKWISKTSGARTEKFVVSDIPSLIPLYKSFGDKVLSEEPGVFSELHLRRATLARTKPGSLGIPPLILKTPFEAPKKMVNLLAILGQFSGRGFDHDMVGKWASVMPSRR